MSILYGKHKINRMKQSYFIGVDVSKEKLDVCVITASNEMVSEKIIRNDQSKIKSYLDKLIRKLKINADALLICCEHTGTYTRPLQLVCHEFGYPLWAENAYKIKKAASDIRGKSDRKDAVRIAEYALRYNDKAVLHQEGSDAQNQLKTLLGARETILEQINTLKQQINETKDFDLDKHKLLKTCFSKSLKVLQKEMQVIEIRIDELVNGQEDMLRNAELLKSIPGIGKQNALHFIVCTSNFTAFRSAKHLACYAGVVPFPNQSGTMFKRDRVSSFANKKLKRLLHLAAMAATRSKGEMRQYYIRKVKEGKNKMSVLNAVRNKLVQRMFAVIQRQSPYVILQR